MSDPPLSKRAKTAVRRALLDPDDLPTPDEVNPSPAQAFSPAQCLPPAECLPPPFQLQQSMSVSDIWAAPSGSLPVVTDSFDAIAVSDINVQMSSTNISNDERLAMPETEGQASRVVLPPMGLTFPTSVATFPTQCPAAFSNLLLPSIHPLRPGAAPAMEIGHFFTCQSDDSPPPSPPTSRPLSPPRLPQHVDPEQPPSSSHPTSPSAPTSMHESGGVSASLPLYDGSPVTSHDCMVSILTYAQANHLSGTATCELIRLLEILLPQPNNLPSSTTLFKKYFHDNPTELEMYFFCSNCWRSTISSKDICSKCLAPNRKVGYYITCPLERQIQRLYARPGFCELLQYKHNRKKEYDANIEDIYDGNIYKEAQRNILENPHNISFTWYTDGVQVFEVSTFDLWLSMLTINELPPDDRHKAENVLISGIWGGDCKPHPNIFLLPMYHDLLKVNKGLSVLPYGSEKDIVVCGFLLFGTCDCPAKSKFMNMKGHAGYYSCPKCFIKGEKSDRTGKVMVFPHEEILELRNDENYQVCFNEGVKSKDGIRGVFGPTILYYMFSGPFINGMTLDSMHSQFMGNMKQLLKLWFDEKFSSEPFSLREKIPVINERLRGLNLPHFVQRLIIDVDKNLCYFKASLCRNLFFYILPIILYNISKPKYFQNFMKLVTGVGLLNKSSIAPEDLVLADLLLNEFSQEFQTLYGLRHMTSNIHSVRHLAKSVEETGPLFHMSCYKYEDLNGKLCALVHGTRHVVLQISNHLGLLTDLPLLIDGVKSECVKKFCLRAIRRSKSFTITEKVCDSVYVVGKITDVSDYTNVIQDLVCTLYGDSCHIRYFDRLYKTGQLYVSDSYEKGSRVSSYCRYNCNNTMCHGNIQKFVKVIDVSGPKYFAFIQKSHDVPVIDVERFVEFSSVGDVDLVPVTQLLCVSFGLKVSGKVYLVDPLNRFEME